MVVAGQGGFASRERREPLHIHTRQLAFARLTRLSPAKSKSAVASTSPDPFTIIQSISLTVVPRFSCRRQPCRSPKTASGRLGQHKQRHQLQSTSALSGRLTQFCSITLFPSCLPVPANDEVNEQISDLSKPPEPRKQPDQVSLKANRAALPLFNMAHAVSRWFARALEQRW